MKPFDQYIDLLGTKDCVTNCTACPTYQVVTYVGDCKVDSACYAGQAFKAYGKVASYYIYKSAVDTTFNYWSRQQWGLIYPLCYIF